MRTASAQLQSLLATRNFFMADLYTFTLTDGTVLRFTSWNQDITADGNTFSSSIGWTRTQSKLTVGLTADTIDLTLQATPQNLVNGTALIASIASGAWDGAQCAINRAFMPTPGDTSAGTVLVFSGQVGNITEVGRIQCQMQAVSKLLLLNVGMPKDLFQPSCRHTLFDGGCTLSRASFQTTGTCSAGSTASLVETGQTATGAIAGPTSAPSLSSHMQSGVSLPANITYYVVVTYVTAYGETLPSPEASLFVAPTNGILSVASPPSATGVTGWNVYVGGGALGEERQNGAPLSIGSNYNMAPNGIYQSGVVPPVAASNGWWALGVIAFTSGANAGLKRVIEGSDSSGAVQLRIPLPVAPAAGDSYVLTPGCDKQMSTCGHKFSNLIHFGGMPFIPVPEMGG